MEIKNIINGNKIIANVMVSIRYLGRFTLLLCFGTLLIHSTQVKAEKLLLSNVPASVGGKGPAPNVIISIDNSTSMSWHIDTDNYTSDEPKKKINVLKSALNKTFGNGSPNSGIIPDGRIRLAFQAMHNTAWADGGGTVLDQLVLGAKNSMKPFSGDHRRKFSSFVSALTLAGGTPSHKMMENAEGYLNAPENIFNPWADNPGVSQVTPYLSCRRAYHVFLTDGVWRNPTSSDRTNWGDGVTRVLPDGTKYVKGAETSRMYTDSYGDNISYASTLSDFAFSSWSRDLQDGNTGTALSDVNGRSVTGITQNMSNSVKPLIRKSGEETFSTEACTRANTCIKTPEFWNPRNDPATWQHITQYSIGFGQGAIRWSAPTRTPRSWETSNPSLDTYGGDFPGLVQGELEWADVKPESDEDEYIRVADLWHMAINGRGKFYSAATADALDAAFTEILSSVIADTSPPVVSIATNSSRLGIGTSTFLASYKADRYSGSLVSRPLDSSSGAILEAVNWRAEESLDAIRADALASRFVFSYDGAKGIPWRTWSALPLAQQTAMSKSSTGATDSNGQSRVDYIRGDRSKELNNTGGIFRNRDSRLGDIVNSNIWYLGKPASGYDSVSYAQFRGTGEGGKGARIPVVYVGSNDGMLHGFVAESWPQVTPVVAGGAEVMAYIPQGVAEGSLRKLTEPNYNHTYFVDGSPITGDAEIGAVPKWTTVLLGTLGLGGKGFFLLDVSDAKNFIEGNAHKLVITDTTASTDPDLGHIVSRPVVDESYTSKSRQIVKMNDGRWAAVVGNGVNSTNEAPVLLIQYLDGDKTLKKVTPCTQPIATNTCAYKGSNGLSTPQLIDLNGDGKVDVAYAGDLKGNVWKFNLSSSMNSQWKVAFANDVDLNGRPFFISKQGAQSFTTAPFWMAHPMGGVTIAIGTGRNLTDSDQSDLTTRQTLYSLWDSSGYSVTASGAVTLLDSTPINLTSDTGGPSTLVQQTIASTPLVDGETKYYASTTNNVDYGPKRGWFMNWEIGGQRSLQNIRLYEGQKILVQTTIPAASTSGAGESCTAGGSSERNFISVLNILTGKPAATPVFTLTNTALANTNLSTREVAGSGVALLRGINKIKAVSSACAAGSACTSLELNMSRYTGARGNWQQLQ